MACLFSFRPKQGTGPFLKFQSNDWFYIAKSVFLAVNASLRWQNKVSGVYLVKAFFLIGQDGLEHFLR